MSPSPFETTPSSPERQPSPDSETEGFERQPSPDSETEGFERQPSPDSEIEGFERQPSPDSETEGFERQPSPDSEIEGFKRQPSPNSDTESFERLSSPDNETEGYKRQSSPDSDTEGFKRQPNECDDPKMRQSSEDKRRIQNEREKDSGFSDTSSECLSPEENAESEAIRVPIAMQEKAQVAYPPIYILQNIILKQRLLIIQPGPRRHRTHSSSYLPILRSYPRIAPRLAQPPAPDSSSLLDVSLRAFALLRRSRETQRALRELRAHTQLFRRAAQGEKGGWETLRRAMEKSGSYWRPVTTSGGAVMPAAGTVISTSTVTSSRGAVMPSAGAVTSWAVQMSSAGPMTLSPWPVTSAGPVMSPANAVMSLAGPVRSGRVSV